MTHTSSKRIAKNTLFLYIRMIVIMLISLYTSRIVLEELGVEDFGVYVVVGGVVSMFSFLNGSMITSTQRYLNYEMGNRGDYSPELKKIFSTSLTIHMVIAGVFLLLAETVGLWFVNYKLVIPPGSLYGANIVYQSAVASFIVLILRVPFNASIIAHERMNLFAILSVVEAAGRLGTAFLLMALTAHKLAWYGFLQFALSFVIGVSFVVICFRNFKECSLKCSFIPSLFKEMIGFAGWNMFGSVAYLVRTQGIGILLNLTFGAAINAAKGVADQVLNASNSLTNNFQTALNPQITKNYASGAVDEMELLAFRGIKFSCFLVWLVALPIMINVNTILSLWLTDVPAYAPLFVVLVLVDSFTMCLFGNPLMTALSATGNIRNYQIVVGLVLIMVLPAGYVALKLGMPPESVLYLNILFNLIAGVTRFEFCKRQIGFSIKKYLTTAFVPILGVLTVSAVFPFVFKYVIFAHIETGRIPELIYLLLISFASIAGATWIIGLNKGERQALTRLVLHKLISQKHEQCSS